MREQRGPSKTVCLCVREQGRPRQDCMSLCVCQQDRLYDFGVSSGKTVPVKRVGSGKTVPVNRVGFGKTVPLCVNRVGSGKTVCLCVCKQGRL